MASTAGSAAAAKTPAAGATALPLKLILVALCMAQFINAYDTTAMNVAVTSVVKSLDTTVSGVQSALVLYSLVMASFMLIGGKLGDVWGRRTTFTLGISMYGVGALITAFSMGLPMMIFGWSLLEGLGSALMIPAIFAIVGTIYPAGKPRVSAFAAVGAMAAMGAALGPLVCGFLTTYLTWRVSFLHGGLRRHRHARPLHAHQGAQAAAAQRRGSTTSAPSSPRSAWRSSCSACCRRASTAGRPPASLRRLGQDADPRGRHLAGHPVRHRRRRRARCSSRLWERHMLRAGKDALLNITMLKNRAVLFGLLAIIAFMFMQAGLPLRRRRCSCRWRSATPPSTAAC